MRLAVLATFLVLLAIPTTAHADEMTWSAPAEAPAMTPTSREVSYAQQTLISDGIAALLTGGFLRLHSDRG